MSKERAVFQRELDNLRKRCEWYVKNQEMVDRDSEALKIANDTIAKMRARGDYAGDTMDETLASADGIDRGEREEVSK